ncbi:AAA family ATPase [Euryarchaeota archaeon]|nr:AAA family ATPase [Euryarchaeota archaeon]
MSGRRELTKQVGDALKAGVPIVTISSFEWERIVGCLALATRREEYLYLRWNHEKGLELYSNDSPKGFTSDHEIVSSLNEAPLPNIINWFKEELNQPAVLHLEDYHHFFNQENHLDAIDGGLPTQVPPWASMWQWRDAARIKPREKKCFILTGPSFEGTVDLQKEILALSLDLPDVNDLRKVHDRVVRRHDFEIQNEEHIERVVQSARGLTTMEAQTAFSLAGINNDSKLDSTTIPSIIAQKRSLLMNAGGVLDYFEPKVSIEDVGGLKNLKQWLTERKGALSADARGFGIQAPKGLLMLGVPGCGKSLTAKAIASMWEYPLVRFDLSKVFGSLVGQTEQQMRQALEVAEAVAPCILWIDEIEKGMAGASSSGDLDSGVTARTFGILLTWMQEKTSPVFVVATSNRVTNLPAEALRKGRFDEIFFVDLPSHDVRKEILEKKISTIGESSGTRIGALDLELISETTPLFSGAELEQLVRDTLYLAFQDGKRGMVTEDFMTVIGRTYPLAVTMQEQIRELRTFAHNRAQPADGDSLVMGISDLPPKEADSDDPNPFDGDDD